MAGNIFFVGLMGAGKTTIGRMLAKHLAKSFYDTDHEIERRTGVNIPLIFELEGEAGFRKRETAIIAELWQRTRNDKNRPLLQTDDPRAKLEQLFTERDALYRETADIVLETGGQSVSSIVHHIEQKLCHQRTVAG